MPETKKRNYDSKYTRQRVVRILTLVDDWLTQGAASKQTKNPDTRIGIATEINRVLIAAFKADPKNKDKIQYLPSGV